MCGIVGIYTEKPSQSVVTLFQLLMLESGIRGLHAAGVYSGGKVQKYQGGVNEVLPQIKLDPKHKLFMGHTRYSTSGDYHDLNNNQPLQLGELTLAHNGIISMSSEFAQIFGEPCVTNNDSEVILCKVAKHALRTNLVSAIAKSLVEVNDISRPIFACALVHGDQDVYLFKDDIRPLHLFWVKEIRCWVWSSTLDIMQRACRYDYEEHELKPFTIHRVGVVGAIADIPLKTRQWRDFSEVGTLIKLVEPEPKQTEHVTRDIDYRIYRRQSFLDYYVSLIVSWDVDPAYPLMKYIIDRYELSREQQYWMMWLYGVFYHVASVHWVMQEFPDFELVDVDRLERWHAKHWRLLQYETDRRHEKGLFVDRFKSYKSWVGEGTQEDKFVGLLDPNGDIYESYRRVNKSLNQLRGFGRYALFYYTEALARCVGLPIMCDHTPLKDCDSSRNGLCHAIKREDLVDCKNLSKAELAFLHKEELELMDEIKALNPSIPVDFWFMETVECAYKGLFRRRRYIGYYIDRLYEEIVSIEHKDTYGATEGVCWLPLEDFREEMLGRKYVNQNGINQEHLHQMIDQGELVLLHPQALEAKRVSDFGIRYEQGVKQDGKYKVVSADRIKDTRKLPYMNWKALDCKASEKIYQVVKERPNK
jgi:hypothetical protein